MRDALCHAFCDSLHVRDVQAGLAVRTGFLSPSGDFIGFYVRHEIDSYRIEDNGRVFPSLVARGLDFKTGSRKEALESLLAEYTVSLLPDDRQFAIENVSEGDLAAAAMRFVAFLLRVGDFALMTEARVASAFRDDVRARLLVRVAGRATIEENTPLLPDLADFPADFVLRADGRPPVGVYAAANDDRALQAVIMRMRATHETHESCSIVALVEKGTSLTAAVRSQASNRLDAVAYFRGDEAASIDRVVREAVGQSIH
jgi:hypothetical protein